MSGHGVEPKGASAAGGDNVRARISCKTAAVRGESEHGRRDTELGAERSFLLKLTPQVDNRSLLQFVFFC